VSRHLGVPTMAYGSNCNLFENKMSVPVWVRKGPVFKLLKNKEKSVELADRAFNQLVQSSCDDFCGFEKPCFQGCGKFSFRWTHILSHQAIFWRIVRLT
jgi:hypothetical protein